MTRFFRLDILLIIVVPLAVAVRADTGNFAGLVDIGSGRKVYLKCHGTSSPTVLLVSGLRASADDWDISDKSRPTVFAGLQSSRVYVPVIALEPRLAKNLAAATPSRSQQQQRMQLPICTPC
jgi:hypothetical protein